MSENNSNNSFLPFVFGAVIGCILGVLFAPKKGSETRQSLMETLNNFQEESAEKISKVKKNLSDLYEDKECSVKNNIKEIKPKINRSKKI